MLNGEGNERGTKNCIKINSKKTNLHVQHVFCLSFPSFCTTTTLFCRTKTSDFLVTHYFHEGIVVCAYSIVFLPTKFASFVFNHAL